MSKLAVNLDLVQKYNVPGPRYTSYPPATQFTDQVPHERLLDGIRANNETARDLSLYFHLPFCQTLCWFCGCTTVITTQQGQSATYLEHIRKELYWMGQYLNRERKVVQLHLGGGTPTFLKPDELRTLGDMVRQRFVIAPDMEASAEVDPRRLLREHVVALREAGFNRMSMGVQDNNAKVQEAVHRIQPFEMTKQAVDWSREEGFKSLNIDLIYGLPYQTPATFEQTIDDVLTLRPDRFAVFSYAHVPWIKPAQKILEKNALPTAEVKLQLLKLTIEKLTGSGYVYIGMDHFARADDELAVAQRQKTLQRNFQGYSTRGGSDIYAFGMSSISQADGIYWQNVKELPEYYAAVNEGRWPIARGYVLNEDDHIRRQTIMRVMCDLELNYADMSMKLGVEFTDYFASELASFDEMEADGLVKLDDSGLVVTDAGRLFIRNIAMRFDAYLPKQTERKFSRTI